LYFVTVVTQGRACLYGEVIDGEMRLNRYGEIVQHAWFDLPRHYANVELGEFVVMPNHVHGIIILNNDSRGGSVLGETTVPDGNITGTEPSPERAQTRPYRKQHGLSEIIRAFKSFSARRINQLRGVQGVPVWQRNYYDHVIRSQHDLERTWFYIQTNPARWSTDEEYPSGKP
jgi:REP element-mobilizing transposase RayT